MIDNANLEKLVFSLKHNNPNLFLGAGFSIGGECNDGKEIPSGKKLKKHILTDFLKLSESSEEYKEYCELPLFEVCSYAKDIESEEKLNLFLRYIFQRVKPADFHYSYSSYPWNKIYTTNIDDIIETVYDTAKKPFVVQNKKTVTPSYMKGSIEIFKLHGCVNNISEGLIFDEYEYLNSILTKNDHRFGDFSLEIQKKDFVFVGSEFDDINIKYYLNQYGDFLDSSSGKLFFINPYPTIKFNTSIKKVGGILIECTAKEFADILRTVNIQRSKIDYKKLIYNGYKSLRLHRETIVDGNDFYSSDLYFGANPVWEDVFFDWDVLIPKVMTDFNEKLERFEKGKTNNLVYAIVGGAYVGKSTIIKRLSNELLTMNYNVVSYEGKSFSSHIFLDYLRESGDKNFALVLDDGSYLYNQIEYLVKRLPNSVRVVFLTSSRPFYHEKRKYSLFETNYTEIDIKEILDQEVSTFLVEKLSEKGFSGILSRFVTEEEKYAFLLKNKDISISLFELNHGYDFKCRFKFDISDIAKEANYRDVLIKLAIFEKLELPYFPFELVKNLYRNRTTGILKRVEAIIRHEKSNGYISLKNSFISETILSLSNKSEILNNLKELLIYISPFVENQTSSYWNELQSVLMREKLLKFKFRFNTKSLKNMLYELKPYYDTNYNYWLQLGIAEQIDGDYDKALNHFVQAETLGPNSYMVKNAIGKNYILQAIFEKNDDVALGLYLKGKESLLNLINEKEENQVKAYSIHSYINGIMKFYAAHRRIPISQEEIKYAQTLLKKMLQKVKDDIMFNKISSEFTLFILRANTGKISYKLDELQSIYKAHEISVDDFEDLWSDEFL